MARTTSKRRSRRSRDIIQTLVFFGVSALAVVGLIAYLWVYTEVDETLQAIEIQQATLAELEDDIKSIQSRVEYLSRADVIAQRARNDLGMITTQPETLTVFVDYSEMVGGRD